MSYLPYARSLVGIPYGGWSGDAIPRDDSTPLYAHNESRPSRELLETQGVSCTGFMNLICRQLNIPVPGVNDPSEQYPGGTSAWHTFLEPYLTSFDPQAEYEDGTLLLRPYKDFQDQGHIALVLNNKTLHSFAFAWEPSAQTTVDPGVTLTDIWPNYYVYAAPPDAWLTVPTK
jgi:hypothetical protein